MLAEIFMVRLEARARLANEAAWPGGGRFVPFVQGQSGRFQGAGDTPVPSGVLPGWDRTIDLLI